MIAFGGEMDMFGKRYVIEVHQQWTAGVWLACWIVSRKHLVDETFRWQTQQMTKPALSSLANRSCKDEWSTVDDMQMLRVPADNIHIGDREVQYRTFAEHQKLLTNLHLHLNTRVLFLNGLVWSRLNYGCHAWRPTQNELNINSTYDHFLRSMVKGGHRRVNPPKKTQQGNEDDIGEECIDWRCCLTNDEIYHRFLWRATS